jgi:PAS domain S-box-containing protein
LRSDTDQPNRLGDLHVPSPTRPRTRSLRSQIIGLLLALALPLGAILAFSFMSEYRVSAERAEGAAVELAVATANGVAQVLGDADASLAELARDLTVLALDGPGCVPWLREVNMVMPQFSNIAVVDATGDIVCSAVPLGEAGMNVRDRSWFSAVSSTRAPAIGRFQTGDITGRSIVVVARPLLARDGSFRGAVVAGVDLRRFQSLLQDLPAPPGAVVTLADDAWTVLARSRDADRWIGQTLPGDTVPERLIAPGAGMMRASGLDGISRVFGFATVRGAQWRVYAGVPETWIYGPVRDAGLRRAIAFALVLIGVSILTLLLFRRVAHALEALVESTRAAATHTGVRVPEEGPSEVVHVARQFNATLASRERAETELVLARERYRSVLRNAVSGIFVCTPRGLFVEVNPALVDMLGCANEAQLSAIDAHDLFVDPEMFDSLASRALAGERLHDVEVEWRRVDDTALCVRLSGSAAKTLTGERVLEWIAEDITERRALEDQVLQTRKLDAIGRLAGGVAHDFNNLLTIMRGQAQFLLMEMSDQDPLREHAVEIVEATTRGARLTRQLLAFGRRQMVQPVPLDINDVVRGLETMLRRVMGENVRIVTHLSDAIDPVLADPGQVEQIVMNLVLNARDAMPAGGEVVLVTDAQQLDADACRGRPGAREGRFTSLTVRDTGQGIAPELIGRVFEPFFTTKPHGAGTGLGLATVYGIVSQTGGFIEVASDPEAGTSFAVFLPVVDASPAVDAPQPTPDSEPASGSILVVEDEAAVRRVVSGILRQQGFRVAEAGSAEEALTVAATLPDLDLLLTDEMMPGLRGSQLAERLIRDRPALRVLFMSGYTDQPPTGSSFQGVPSAFLPKPFSQQTLLELVARLLRREPAGV